MSERYKNISLRERFAAFLDPESKIRLLQSQESVRILEHDMENAGKIQRNMLPEYVPVIPGYDIGAAFEPAKNVGGDFYDFNPLISDSNSMGFVIADVMDKGLSAALYALLTRGMLHSTLDFYSKATPEKVLMSLNLDLRHIVREDVYLTMVLGELNPKTHKFRFARAGHQQPLAFDTEGRPLLGKASNHGQPLNMFDDPDFETGSVTLPPGGAVLLYTDGVIDETNSEGHFFGQKRLENLVSENPNLPAQKLCDLIIEEVERHRGSTPQFDDCTMVAIKREK